MEARRHVNHSSMCFIITDRLFCPQLKSLSTAKLNYLMYYSNISTPCSNVHLFYKWCCSLRQQLIYTTSLLIKLFHFWSFSSLSHTSQQPATALFEFPLSQHYWGAVFFLSETASHDNCLLLVLDVADITNLHSYQVLQCVPDQIY